MAVKMATRYDSWNDLRPNLEDALPFNSEGTRKRRCSSLGQWVFDMGNMNSIGVRVWRSYEDEELVNQILRGRYLDYYPVVGGFVLDTLAELVPGSELPHDAIVNHLIQERVGSLENSTMNLRLTMRDLGFIQKVGRKYVVSESSLPHTAFLILLHCHLSPESASIPVSEIVAHPTWRYLGGRDESEVRAALSNAAARDAISRYTTVDELEQVTTRFSLTELIERRVRLDA